MSKIAFVGNVCNFAYWLAKWGQDLGFDTHAIIEADNTFPRDRPDWEDPSYDVNAPPPWVHFYRAGSSLSRALSGTVDSSLVQTLDRFESVQTISPAAAIAVGSSGYEGHLLHHTIGSFTRTTSWFRQPDAADSRGLRRFALPISPRRLPTVLRFRRALAQARQIIVSTPIEHFEVDNSSFGAKLRAIPIGYDMRTSADFAQSRLRGRQSSGPITLFMPARQHWAFKGQNLVLHAIASIPANERKFLRLSMLDWGIDRERSRQLVSDLGLADITTFSPMMKKHELWNALADPRVVVIDQFPEVDLHGGGLGGVARDALSVGAPVLTHARPSVQTTIYSASPPVFHAEANSAAIGDQIRTLLALTPLDLATHGSAGRDWMERECDYTTVVPRYVASHEAVVVQHNRPHSPDG